MGQGLARDRAQPAPLTSAVRRPLQGSVGPIWEKRGQTGNTCPLIWTRKETTKSHRSPPAGAHLDGRRDEQEALTRAAQA